MVILLWFVGSAVVSLNVDNSHHKLGVSNSPAGPAGGKVRYQLTVDFGVINGKCK